MGKGALAVYSPWDYKESDATEHIMTSTIVFSGWLRIKKKNISEDVYNIISFKEYCEFFYFSALQRTISVQLFFIIPNGVLL